LTVITERYGRWPGILRCLAGFVLACSFSGAWAKTEAALAPALLAQYTRLQPQLQHNAFERPLVLQSAESADGLSGDIYAVVAYPFATVSRAMRSPVHWCEVLMLHLNTKYCRAVTGPNGSAVRVNIGKKTPQPISAAPRVELHYIETTVSPTYFAITLSAKDGPLGTSNYRIHLEAVELPGNESFLHFTYAYDVGVVGRVAMQTYLATLGAGKVGFSQVGKGADSQPVYVAGMRGVVERNTMRYYLAIDSFLASLSKPPAAQTEYRLNAWFDAVERYPRQLHEIERADYLAMKRTEIARLQSPN